MEAVGVTMKTLSKLDCVYASMDVEGLKPSEEAKKWIEKCFKGTMTPDRVRELIKEKYLGKK